MVGHPGNEPQDVPKISLGARVVIRRKLSDEEAIAEQPSAANMFNAPTLTDVVGEVTDLSPTSITVQTRRAQVTISRADIVAAKRIPAARGRRSKPHRAISIAALDELMVDGWRPAETQWLGRILLRASGGYTGRANSALILGDSGTPDEETLHAIHEWYQRRSAPALIQVSLPSGVSPEQAENRDPLLKAAVHSGWEVFQPTTVMTASTHAVMEYAETRDLGIHESETLIPPWWALADERMRTHEQSARGILTRSDHQVFLTLVRDGEPVGAARVTPSTSGWAGIFSLSVAPEGRRKGYGRRLVQACAQTAARQGCENLYLQVSSDNEGAIALYEKLGFTTHHTYVYARETSSAQESSRS